MRAKQPDYFYVSTGHAAIHERLENWARWVIPRPVSWIQPMFRKAQSNARQWHPPEIRALVNPLDGQLIEKMVCQLPEKHKEALRWAYVYRSQPFKVARRLAVSESGLFDLVTNARQILLNRGCK